MFNHIAAVWLKVLSNFIYKTMDKNSMSSLDNFFSQFKPLAFKRRQVILHDSTNTSNVFYIVKGNVRLFLNSEDGEELTALILKKGDLFPFNWMNESPNIYNFEAMTEISLYSAPREKLVELLKSDPTLLIDLINHLNFAISALIYRLQHIVFGNAQAKVASILLTSAKRFGEIQASLDISIQIPLTHQDIATAAGITRETASIEIKKLENQGLISYQGRTLIVKDLHSLEEASYL